MEKSQDAVSQNEVDREKKVHGVSWGRMYGGYFQSEVCARPLVTVVSETIHSQAPDVVADLGGGTGFIIQTLAQANPEASVRRWVDMDLSEEQLGQVVDERIHAVRASMLDFRRSDLASEGEALLLLTRSTFHYVGMAGQRKLLEHIRSQMKSGEYFIAQVAAFEDEVDALCLSELFERMQTEKWLIPLEALKSLVCETGFALERTLPAPPLLMRSDEMEYRYDVTPERMALIMRDLLECYNRPRFLSAQEAGFSATLNYFILVCRAADYSIPGPPVQSRLGIP